MLKHDNIFIVSIQYFQYDHLTQASVKQLRIDCQILDYNETNKHLMVSNLGSTILFSELRLSFHLFPNNQTTFSNCIFKDF